ncbi:unnamed protein product [Victoria cruziana]
MGTRPSSPTSISDLVNSSREIAP